MTSRLYFDAIAPQWETVRHSFFTDAVRDKAIAIAQVHPGQVVADVGAGSGFVTQALLAQGLSVLAVDASGPMLAELRARMGAAPGVMCLVGEAQSLPIPDACVAHVFGNMVLHHVEDPPRAIVEMARILRPGGHLVVTDVDAYDDPALRDEHHDRWMGFERTAMRDWLVAAGLNDASVEGSGECCCSGTSTLGIFVAHGVKRGLG